MIYLKKYWPLVLVIAVAVFFRFFRLTDFQYWSPDEEILVAVVRPMAIGSRFLLVSPNSTLAISLGPFFHWLTAIIFRLANFDIVKIVSAGSVLGVATSLLIYATGTLLFNRRTAFLSALFYAGSFVAVLGDRRWWPLSLDPFLVTLAILSTYLVTQKRLIGYFLLAISWGFSFHSDPSLAIVIVASVASFIILKIPIERRGMLLAAFTLTVFVLPITLFELRHPGAISSPVWQLFQRLFFPVKNNYLAAGSVLSPLDFFGYISRGFFPVITSRAEEYVATYVTHKNLFPNLLTVLLVALGILFPFGQLWAKSKEKSSSLIVLLSFFVSFFIGLVSFSLATRIGYYQHYFAVAWPIVFFLAAYTLDKLLETKIKFICAGMIIIFFATNYSALTRSRMDMPVAQKARIVDQAISKIGKDNFSLVVYGGNSYLGGMGAFFYLRGYFPSNASYYIDWDWVYRAYSLYSLKPDNYPKKVAVTIAPNNKWETATLKVVTND